MLAPSSFAALLYALASLVLVQALAAAPHANEPSARSKGKGIDPRDAISWLKAQRAQDEDERPKFQARLAAHHASNPQPASPTALETRADTVQVQHSAVDATQQRLRIQGLVDREPALQHPDSPTLVSRSAAPKVLGLNICLIIAWLALIYLMYRTGSY